MIMCTYLWVIMLIEEGLLFIYGHYYLYLLWYFILFCIIYFFSFGVEVILLLFLFKCLYPKHIVLLRGNHETDYLNMMYGFKGEGIS
jgi:hypothetical protein